MASQEKERSAIARELHDELGQVLTALRMDSVWLQERLKRSDAKASERALTMCQLIDKNIEDVRGMAFRLRPGVLDDLGLVDALDWYTTDFERRTEITCVFEYDNVPPLSETVATAAYRITQEAITNVARHAFASRVEVVLKARNSTLSLAVVDDGRGFNPLELSDAEGLGVAGMRERASLVGGTLEVYSQPGEGTRVLFKVPLDGKRQLIIFAKVSKGLTANRRISNIEPQKVECGIASLSLLQIDRSTQDHDARAYYSMFDGHQFLGHLTSCCSRITNNK